MSKYKRPICRGSYVLGSACGHCERCADERNGKLKKDTPDDTAALKAAVNALVSALYKCRTDYQCAASVVKKRRHMDTSGAQTEIEQVLREHASAIKSAGEKT